MNTTKNNQKISITNHRSPMILIGLLLLLLHPLFAVVEGWGGYRRRKMSHAAKICTSLRAGGGEYNDSDYADYPCTPAYTLPDDTDNDGSTKVGILFIDSFSEYHTRYMSHQARRVYKAGVVNALSEYMTKGLYDFHDQMTDHLPSRVPVPGAEKDWAAKLPFKIVGIICESDSGLQTAERIGAGLGLEQSDGVNPARRNKFLMNEAMEQHGLLTVKQKLCESKEEALSFCKQLLESQSGKCVVKPSRGVGSSDVFLCQSAEEVEEAFDVIHGSFIYGSTSDINESVLVQEFAEGVEYAVDVVSKNGEHKVAAVWKYDKRPANGAPFVYFATKLVDTTDDEEAMAACRYAMASLDALELRWGMSHIEVMVNLSQGTRLIEVNCRQHNMDFAPITTLCIGYNSLDLTLAAYLGDQCSDGGDNLEALDWDLIPQFPTTRALGCVMHLVCFQEGKVVKINGIEEIEALESVRSFELYPLFDVGEVIEKTKDIKTDSGWVHLMNDDSEQFYSDYNRIIEIMGDMFEVE